MSKTEYLLLENNDLGAETRTVLYEERKDGVITLVLYTPSNETTAEGYRDVESITIKSDGNGVVIIDESRENQARTLNYCELHELYLALNAYYKLDRFSTSVKLYMEKK